MPPATVHVPARARVGLQLAIAALIAVGVGVAVGAVLTSVSVALVLGWVVFAALFLATVWLRVGRLDAAGTAHHATREDPTIRVSHAIVLLASVASLASVGLLLTDAGKHGRITASILAVVSVAASWLLVHTLFTLRYAGLYYRDNRGGIDFNDKTRPTYREFAYLAFTVGMTYQVSDTDLTRPAIRHTVLRQALLSYLLGAVVIACTINLIAGLA